MKIIATINTYAEDPLSLRVQPAINLARYSARLHNVVCHKSRTSSDPDLFLCWVTSSEIIKKHTVNLPLPIFSSWQEVTKLAFDHEFFCTFLQRCYARLMKLGYSLYGSILTSYKILYEMSLDSKLVITFDDLSELVHWMLDDLECLELDYNS